MKTIDRKAGGYRYIPGVMQYSAGVSALPGYRIERARFLDPVPMAAGFKVIAAHLRDLGRPLAAFCACELRSPGQFSETGFENFNRAYAATLTEWGIMESDNNPVARSNVCPEIAPPSEPSFHAFSYTVEESQAPASFVIAGSGEVPEGMGNYRDHIVRGGETSSDALREKARYVLSEMERRMAHFEADWNDITGAQIYTIHDIHPFLPDELATRGSLRHGATWHFNRPPIVGLEYEMDCRRVLHERVLLSA